jgi:hypothetical protein
LNRRFKLDKRTQLFIRSHNETLSVIAMCVSNEDRLPFGIYGCDAAPAPPGFAEIVSDYFPARCCGLLLLRPHFALLTANIHLFPVGSRMSVS